MSLARIGAWQANDFEKHTRRGMILESGLLHGGEEAKYCGQKHCTKLKILEIIVALCFFDNINLRHIILLSVASIGGVKLWEI